MARKAVDWESVEREYRAGIRSLRDIAGEVGVSEGAVRKRAKAEGWERDLSARITSKAKVALAAVDDMDRAGFVYVVYVEDTSGRRFYKIGMAGSFSSRLSAHQCSSPFEVCVACAYFTGNMRHEERALHQMFSGRQVRGEWFDLSDDDLRLIASRSLISV